MVSNDALKARTLDALSGRERAVAEKFASGMTYREIGEALFIAPTTVRTHLAAVYEKLGVRNKIGLAGRFADRASAAERSSLPVLAVLPIESYSPDGQWSRFADGLSADIITDLARYSKLSVIAFHTMKACRDNVRQGNLGVVAVSRDLGADYVLEGQLRADDRRIRLTVQLSDARSGGSLWSERYDRPVEDIFTLQDSLTESIINVLAGSYGALATVGRNAVRRKPPASLRAYDCYLLAVEQQDTFSRAGNAEAIRLLSRALELDPTFVRAWTELAYAYSIEACSGYSDDAQRSIQNWRSAIETAIQFDPTDSHACTCLGDLLGCLGDLEGAERAHQRALEYGYNHADTLALLGGSKALVAGDLAEAIPLIERAMRLNPLAPPWYFGMHGRILFAAGRHREAIAALRRSSPDSSNMLMFLALAHAAVDETDEAASFAVRLKEEFPEFSVEGFIAHYPVTNPDAAQAIRQAAKLVKLN